MRCTTAGTARSPRMRSIPPSAISPRCCGCGRTICRRNGISRSRCARKWSSRNNRAPATSSSRRARSNNRIRPIAPPPPATRTRSSRKAKRMRMRCCARCSSRNRKSCRACGRRGRRRRGWVVVRMQNAECKMQKGLRLLFLHFAFCILHSAAANELTVDRTTLNADDTLTITVSLDGSFTSIDSVNVPLQNLKIVGAPAYSSQIAWVNGTLTQRKSYQYQARPVGPGNALVGPVVLETRDGQRDTLSPIAVQVLPDTTGGSNDPQQILRELLATHRDAFFIVCETDRKTAVVGEEVVATWTLYNGTSVEQWEIANVRRRDD